MAQIPSHSCVFSRLKLNQAICPGFQFCENYEYSEEISNDIFNRKNVSPYEKHLRILIRYVKLSSISFNPFELFERLSYSDLRDNFYMNYYQSHLFKDLISKLMRYQDDIYNFLQNPHVEIPMHLDKTYASIYGGDIDYIFVEIDNNCNPILKFTIILDKIKRIYTINNLKALILKTQQIKRNLGLKDVVINNAIPIHYRGHMEFPTKCCICLTCPIDTILYPCRHALFCKKCISKQRQNTCPICRRPIQNSDSFFM